MPGKPTRVHHYSVGGAVACSSLVLVVCLCLFCVAQPARAGVVWSGDIDPADPTTWTSSTYGYIGTDPLPSIYHTNRAFIDANDAKSNPVSTFAVTVPGDVNKDLRVDFADLAKLAENWMIGTTYSAPD